MLIVTLMVRKKLLIVNGELLSNLIEYESLVGLGSQACMEVEFHSFVYIYINGVYLASASLTLFVYSLAVCMP